MREFSNNIAQSFVSGLRPDPRQFRSSESLVEAENVRCSQFGMESPVGLEIPFGAGFVYGHPFPQVIKSHKRIFLCDETSIDIIDPSTDPWSQDSVNLVDLNGVQAGITSGGEWHLIDMDDNYFLMNGESVVFTDPLEDFMEDGSNTNYVMDNIQIRTGAYHQGRALLGGLDGDKFWTGYWLNMFDQIKGLNSKPKSLSQNGIKGNTVFWSSIGAFDFPVWLYFGRRAFFGNTVNPIQDIDQIEVKNTAFYESLLRNEFGFMDMTFMGDVLRIMPIGNNIVVYGNDGISLLKPYMSGDSQISTFSKQKLSDIGISFRSCVGGDMYQHLIVDNKGDLWRYNGEGFPKRLGYSEYISPILNEDLRITYNQQEGEFYISGDGQCFILTSSGLSEFDASLSSGFWYLGDMIVSGEVEETQPVLVTTAQYDFGIRGIKTIASLQIGSKHSEPVSLAVDYRFSDNEDWSRTSFVPVNKEGGAFIRITGTDFRFVIACEDNLGFELDYMQVKWQASDKRQIRGAYVSPNAT